MNTAPTVAQMRSAVLKVDKEMVAGLPSHKLPIYQNSTFPFQNPREMEKAFKGEILHDVYGLLSNPNHRGLEKKLFTLEQGGAAQVCASGRSSILTALFALSRPGTKIVAHEELYGGTYSILELLENEGRRVQFVDAREASAVADALDETVAVVLLESPSNPSLHIIDIAACSQAALSICQDIIILVDNTFATPFNQRPLTLGANIVVVESLTKYLNGKGTYFGGAIIGSEVIIEKVYPYAVLAPMDPGVAWEISENIIDFLQAMPIHNRNAWEIAHFLVNDSRVATVHYPGLASHRNHRVAATQMQAFDRGIAYGGMVSFELHGSREYAEQFITFLAQHGTLITHAVSLGCRDSLIEMPFYGTHTTSNRKVNEKLIRFSTGIENHFDLQNEIYNALVYAFPSWA